MINDFRFAFRQLRKSPGFTFVAILTLGVRLALGAGRRQIVSLMLRQGARLLAVGLLLGFFTAFALSRLIRSLLFEVSATDPGIYLAVSLLLGSAAVVACWIPARRASRVDPMITLRAE